MSAVFGLPKPYAINYNVRLCLAAGLGDFHQLQEEA
jgi:hypothetical protein